jgi:hypothetical protein
MSELAHLTASECFNLAHVWLREARRCCGLAVMATHRTHRAQALCGVVEALVYAQEWRVEAASVRNKKQQSTEHDPRSTDS